MYETIWKRFNHTSLEYLEYLSGFAIIKNDDDAFILKGYNSEAGCLEFHWASNDSSYVIKAVTENREECLITFIPKKWVTDFEQAGFRVRNIWRDYWKNTLDDICDIDDIEFLKSDEIKVASDVTISCRGQSRGFTGQTVQWISGWLDGSCDGGEGVRDSAIIVKRDNKNNIIALACTGVYGAVGKETAWIREIAVRPEYQNKGLGGKLIGKALSYCKKHEAKRGFLAADDCNRHAIHLYKKYGFIPSEGDGQIDMVFVE